MLYIQLYIHEWNIWESIKVGTVVVAAGSRKKENQNDLNSFSLTFSLSLSFVSYRLVHNRCIVYKTSQQTPGGNNLFRVHIVQIRLKWGRGCSVGIMQRLCREEVEGRRGNAPYLESWRPGNEVCWERPMLEEPDWHYMCLFNVRAEEFLAALLCPA